jgi:hypothetical protein
MIKFVIVVAAMFGMLIGSAMLGAHGWVPWLCFVGTGIVGIWGMK